MKRSTMAASLLAAGLAVAASQPASAAIKCRDGYQRSGGAWIATPYCQDEYLAQVARRYYGIRTSGHRMRHSYSAKESICRVVGYDHRVAEICAPFLDRNKPNKRWFY